MCLVLGDIATILVYEARTEGTKSAEAAVERVRRDLGLDRPLLVQYMEWL